MRGTALCLLLFATTSLAFSQERPKFKFMPGPKPGGGEVKVTVGKGGTVESQKDEYSILTGDVRIEYQDIKMRADKVTMNQKTKDVTAEGNVIIDQGPTRVTATQAIYNLDSKIGTFFNATATLDPSMYFSGDRIEKIDEDTYRMANGIFTSCDLDRPAWSFHVGSADVTVDDYAHLRNLSFRARNIPVFYAPRMVWPTKRERSQGLLIPRLRITDRFGVRLENGYFIPVGDSADATVYADASSNGYFGAGVDVRYVPSENIKIGDFRGHLVNNVESKEVEWKYQYRHAQENLPGGFRGVVDVQDYSNLEFFRRYDHDPTLQTISNIYSSAYVTKNRPTYSLNVLTDRRDIIFGDMRQRYEQLPSVQFRMYPQRVLGMPLYFQLESSSSHLRTGAITGRERTISADYFRTDLFPTLSLQLRTPAWFSVKPQISLRETYYSASRDVATGAVIEDDPLTRFYAQGQVETIGPSFSKVFNRSVGGFTKFKHVIEPRVRYVYTTNVANQNEIIRFDLVDSPALPIVQHSVEYSLTQRLIGKESGPNGNAREVLSFALRQSVALSDPFPGTSSFTLGGEQKYTPLNANLRFNPYQSITVDANATYGNVSHQLDTVSLSTNLVGTGKNANKYLGFTYFSTLKQAGFPADDPRTKGSSGIRLNTGAPLLHERIRADVQLNYDATEKRFLEQRYIAGWTGSCYGIGLEYRRYIVFNATKGKLEPDWSYGIAITLKNVGTIPLH
ncbi:MAG TPA: LPS assembly protein LptD [Thermoanaerobaculia bacterium]|nr:LPS assembly protein LptD [Thermoanaerobaculia bacterium]